MGELSTDPTLNAGETDATPQRQINAGDNLVVGEPKQQQANVEAAPTAQQHPIIANHAFSSQLDMASPPASFAQQGPYDMTSMNAALPAIGYRPAQFPQGGHRFVPAASPPVMQQVPQMHPYGGPPPMPMNEGFYVHQPPVPQYYGSHMSPSLGPPPMPARQDMAYYPDRMMMSHPPSGFYYPQTAQYPPQPQRPPGNMVAGPYLPANPVNRDARMPRSPVDGHLNPLQNWRQGREESSARQNAVRGPPRKPRQSGHAIWVGNLPPQTDLMSLVHHVCKETTGLESLFLISKSNCAFANFKDEDTCTAAQQQLHDSKFQSVRLVSRLRKNTVEGASGLTAPTGPAASTATTVSPVESHQDGTVAGLGSLSTGAHQPANPKLSNASEAHCSSDKFFILKSLTMEDLELSVRTGVWATQSHNEEALNTAFKAGCTTCAQREKQALTRMQNFDNVYLIFSANKSGEYFGYARMVSEINEDPAAAVEFAPKIQAATNFDLPKAIPTEATEYAPKGRIIDDSARGTIFWEAEREESEPGSDDVSEASSTHSGGTEEESKTWGKPFNLEWLSINRLPFYRTRGLRNPWNSNREVKIARDGTELEPSVGRRLIGLFNRVQSPGFMPAVVRPPMAMMHGYAPTREHGH
ncbi:hypothetical protein HIM_03882 [Hirsutella minnesotensis 3608]|uniref:YTH domain-containing protein n=1 Tax=Hirsutella minnesotensis 3608 TaxID=1043627 RepID=A0A0F7ZLM5_9HYPO|nr:hypothetical protein HIM_03882 [Hirsutella minnesotensis 3608]